MNFLTKLRIAKRFRQIIFIMIAIAWSSLAFCGEIHDATESGDLAKITSLLKANPDLVSKDKEGFLPIHYAGMYDRVEVAKLLLANKADINAKNTNGSTALHFAAMLGRRNMAEYLLSAKAEVDAKDKDGETPLFYVANKDIAELLLKNKASVNIKNKDGFTPLHMAVLEGKKTVAEVLRQHGGKE
jgi:ankyrin repeat protein